MITEHDLFEDWKKTNPSEYWVEHKLSIQEKSIDIIHGIGGTLMAISNRSKFPLKGSHGVDDSPLSKEDAVRQYVLGRNLAVRVSSDDSFNKNYIILDFEGKFGSHEVFWDHVPLWMDFVVNSSLSVETPSGGFHVYCRLSNMSDKEQKACITDYVKRMSHVQVAVPIVQTYALIPYSKIGKKTVSFYVWKNDKDMMDLNDLLDRIIW